MSDDMKKQNINDESDDKEGSPTKTILSDDLQFLQLIQNFPIEIETY